MKNTETGTDDVKGLKETIVFQAQTILLLSTRCQRAEEEIADAFKEVVWTTDMVTCLVRILGIQPGTNAEETRSRVVTKVTDLTETSKHIHDYLDRLGAPKALLWSTRFELLIAGGNTEVENDRVASS